MKKDWINHLEYSCKYEQSNRQKMININKIEEYDYLTGKNRTLNRYKSAFEIYKNNNNQIPDDKWLEILTSEN